MADSQSELLGRAKSLLEHGRYADARHEYLRLKQVAPADDLGLIQQAEYGLTVCAVELDDNVAEQRMIGFLNRYPGSVHAADIRFRLALHYCETEQWESAKREFEAVSYKALSQRTAYFVPRSHRLMKKVVSKTISVADTHMRKSDLNPTIEKIRRFGVSLHFGR